MIASNKKSYTALNFWLVSLILNQLPLIKINKMQSLKLKN